MLYVGASTTPLDGNCRGYTEPNDPAYKRIVLNESTLTKGKLAFPVATENWGAVSHIFFSKSRDGDAVFSYELNCLRCVEADISLYFEMDYNTELILSGLLKQLGEDFEMSGFRTQGILKIWENDKRDKLMESYNLDYAQLKTNDSNYSELQNIVNIFNDKLNVCNQENVEDINAEDIISAIYMDSDISIYTKETQDKMSDCKQKYKNVLKALDNKIKEIMALLSSCETYEQEMVILKARGIIDENYIVL